MRRTIKSKSLVCGSFHSLILMDGGKVYGCGEGYYGQLGIGPNKNKNKFTEMIIPKGVDVDTVVPGTFHTVVLAKNGDLYSVGSNYYGQLGNGSYIQYETLIKATLPPGVKVDKVVAGFQTVILSRDGDVYACGIYGKYGCGDERERDKKTAWTKIELPFEGAVSEMVSGDYHALVLSEAGKVYAFGDNFYGQLGFRDKENADQFVEVKLPKDFTPRKVVAGGNQSFIISTEGKVLGCGENNFGQLGWFDCKGRSRWLEVLIPEGVEVRDVITKKNYTLIVSKQGELYICGMSFFGLTSDELKSVHDFCPFRKIQLPEGILVDQVMAGNEHILVTDKEGAVYACGRNKKGQLGVGDNDFREKFVKLESLPRPSYRYDEVLYASYEDSESRSEAGFPLQEMSIFKTSEGAKKDGSEKETPEGKNSCALM